MFNRQRRRDDTEGDEQSKLQDAQYQRVDEVIGRKSGSRREVLREREAWAKDKDMVQGDAYQ